VEIRKVYEGLAEVERGATYHLGHYEVDFQDGPLRFQLHAFICSDASCLCDELQINWLAEGTTFHTWYNALREWRDQNHEVLKPELLEIFRIVEKTEVFQERISHLQYLRRKQVLEETGKMGDIFTPRIPKELLLEGASASEGLMGKLRVQEKGKLRAYPFGLEFCGDPQCFCDNLILVVHEGTDHRSFVIDARDQWQAEEDTPVNGRFMTKVKAKAMRLDRFKKLLAFLRGERRLHNYHRYVQGYHANSGRPKP